MSLKDFAAPNSSEPKQAQQSFFVVAFAFGCHLGFDDRSVGGQHEIAVASRLAVLFIVEIEDRSTIVNSTTDSRHLRNDWIDGNHLRFQKFIYSDAKRDPASRYGCRPGASVRLYHVAIDDDLSFADLGKIHHRSQRPSDQTLDLLRSARLLSSGRLAVAPCLSRPWKHSIFGGDPSLSLAAKERWDFLLNARGA